MDDSISFTTLSMIERVQNLKYIQTWFQNKKTANANTDLLKLFEDLQQFCSTPNETLQNTPEFVETRQLIGSFCEKASRIKQKQKQKQSDTKPIKQESQKQRMFLEDDEVENNRDILIEVKRKLQILIKQQISIPFIINFIKCRMRQSEKLTLTVDDCLLDSINFIMVKMKIDTTPKDLQNIELKELLLQLLEIIWNQRNEQKLQLNEIFFKLKRGQLLKTLEKKQQDSEVDKYTKQSSQILMQLQEYCNGIETAKLQAGKTNGLYNFQRLLLSFCWSKQIELSEMLFHTKISGRLDKLKSDREHSNVIRLRQKITFLRFVYSIPIVREWCDKNEITPLEIQAHVPQYFQEEYDQYMSLKKMQLYPDQKEDHFIESQLKFLVYYFHLHKQKIKVIFKDLRFQQNKAEIFELYQQQISEFQGDFELVTKQQLIKQQKDIVIACCIKNLEIKLSEEEKKKEIQNQQITKFDYLEAKNKNIQFSKTSYDRHQYSYVMKFSIIKIFHIDMIALDQPFPYVLEYLYVKDGKLEQKVKNITLQGEFFYCPQIREYLSKKYQFNVTLEEIDKNVYFTYIPTIHFDHVKSCTTITWEEIVQHHLKLIIKYRTQLIQEINYVVNSQYFVKIKQELDPNCSIRKQMDEVEAFNITQLKNKKKNI